MTTLEETRRAQDNLILLWALIGGTGLAFTGWMIAAPMISCLGLPFAMLSALAYAVSILVMTRLEVPWWRTITGIVMAFGGLGLFFYAYLDGLGVVAEHFLDRPGAPSLMELGGSALWLAAGTAAITASVALRRRGDDYWLMKAVATLTFVIGPLAWGGLALAALMGLPLSA